MPRIVSPDADRLRRERNRAIIADYCLGLQVSKIAQRHAVTSRFVTILARKHDLSRPHGRPRIGDVTDAEMPAYTRWRRKYGAAMALEMVRVGR